MHEYDESTENLGVWPQFRHDSALSGHQPKAGDIRQPKVGWRHFLGGPVYDGWQLEIEGVAHFLLLYGGNFYCHQLETGFLVWQSSTHGFESVVGIEDVDRDGHSEILATNGKTIFVLSANEGRVLWQEYLGPPYAGGFMATGALLHHFRTIGSGFQLVIGLLSSKEVVVYDFSPGAANPLKLHTLWMDDFFHPSILAVDIDGDGVDEIVITKLSAIYVFDPSTGKLKSQCRWSSGGTAKRNYGLFSTVYRASHLPPDFLVLSDRVSRHIAVVKNDGKGTLSNAWDRFMEHIYESDETELRFCTSSIPDNQEDSLERDRNPAVDSILVSIYNATGDNRWWLEEIDFESGKTLQRFPDFYIRDAVRLRQDKRIIVLGCISSRRVPEDIGTIIALELRDGAIRELWRKDKAVWCSRFDRPAMRLARFRSELPPSDSVWRIERAGEIEFFYTDFEGRLWKVRLLPEISAATRIGLMQCVVAILDACTDKVIVSTSDARVVVMDARGRFAWETITGYRLRQGSGPYYMAKPMSAPIVFQEKGNTYIAVPDTFDSIHLLRWNPEGGHPESIWKRRGRGRIGPEETYHSVSMIEINGSKVIVYSEVGDGVAALVAVNISGEIVRRWVVPQLPAAPKTPAARVGIHEYFVQPGMDPEVIVSGYRSHSMNSEISVAVSEFGELLWERKSLTVGDHVLGLGPWNLPSYNSEAQTSTFLAKDTLIELDLRTGELRQQPKQLRPFNTAQMKHLGLKMDDFAAYGAVARIDVNRDGVEEWVLLGNYGGFGVVSGDCTLLWWKAAPLSSTSGCFSALADIDGDGILEMGVSFADGIFSCLRADTGEEKWRLALNEVATEVLSCDIDGDGKREFILGTREGTVIALGAADNGSGIIRWEINLQSTLGPLVAADFNQDGMSEILVVAGDGYLYSIDREGRATVQQLNSSCAKSE